MTPFTRLTSGELARLLPRLRPEGECLVFTGSLDKDGYGQFYLRRKNRRAHRVAYYAAFGEIPPDKVVNHKCRNRACANPDHLELITPSENSLKDSIGVGALNAKKTHCLNGHPFDRKYGKQRSYSRCEAAKTKRLRNKWKNAPDFFNGC